MKLETGDTIPIVVRTKAAQTKIYWDETLRIYRMDINAVPEKGLANLEIIKYFSKKHKTKVEIVTGKKSKKKILRVL